MSDPVADDLSRLHRREAAALESFRAAAEPVLARFPTIAATRDRALESALESALRSVSEFRGIEDAGRRQAARAAVAEIHARELARLASPAGAAALEQILYARLQGLPPAARRLAILAFVERQEFVEVVRALDLNGAALAAEITEIRKLVNPDAAQPPSQDYPAYVRVPFLVSGHLAPEDAQRVREYLAQSEACRGAYRDLDGFERRLARLGPAAGEPHPDPAEWWALADGGALTPARRDALAEHLRLCVGCAAVLRDLQASAPRGAARTLLERLDGPAARRKLAAASVALSFLLPWLVFAAARGERWAFEFGGAGAVDAGRALRADLERAPHAIPPAGGPPISVQVDYTPRLAFDLTLESSGGAILASVGDAPVRDLGGDRGAIVLSIRGAPLPPGEYRLHVLRRYRDLGSDSLDLVVPLVVR